MKNSQELVDPASGAHTADGSGGPGTPSLHAPGNPPPHRFKLFRGLPPFWQNRLIEAGLILSMALYYLVGNESLGPSRLFHVNPLVSLPFLAVFAVLTWYRLPFAVALLPLALPYYLNPKTVYSHYSFSPAEIVLAVCAVVALAQLLFRRGAWDYRLSWRELRDWIGPFLIPIAVFVVAAGLSIVVAYDHSTAARSFRREVFDPLLYLVLALFCLRSRGDVGRLLGALLGSGLLVALLGLAQYFLFRNQLVLEADGIRRVHAMYGSANSIGLFFDYMLPVGLALFLMRTPRAVSFLRAWWPQILAVVLCIPLLGVLYLSQSRGAWIAIPVAALFVLACSIRRRTVLLLGGALLVIGAAVTLVFFHQSIANFIFGGHESTQGISTATKRLYLWQSALHMIHDHLWFGVGMDNWLCYYSFNKVCTIPIPKTLHSFYYLIKYVPGTRVPTGLSDEPDLSHPHNIFLHVWVSMGIFGVLAFTAVLVLFYWLFARILSTLRRTRQPGANVLEWMTIGVGAAMLAALVQGQVDSAFLEEDLAFCFWTLVVALLILRVLSKTPWRGRRSDT